MTRTKEEADRLFEEGLKAYDNTEDPKALQKFQECRSIYSENSNVYEEVRVLNAIGLIYLRQCLDTHIYGNIFDHYADIALVDPVAESQVCSQALEAFQLALETLEKTSEESPRATLLKGKILNGIGSFYYSDEQYNEAEKYYQQSLSIIKNLASAAIENEIKGEIEDERKSVEFNLALPDSNTPNPLPENVVHKPKPGLHPETCSTCHIGEVIDVHNNVPKPKLSRR